MRIFNMLFVHVRLDYYFFSFPFASVLIMPNLLLIISMCPLCSVRNHRPTNTDADPMHTHTHTCRTKMRGKKLYLYIRFKNIPCLSFSSLLFLMRLASSPTCTLLVSGRREREKERKSARENERMDKKQKKQLRRLRSYLKFPQQKKV